MYCTVKDCTCLTDCPCLKASVFVLSSLQHLMSLLNVLCTIALTIQSAQLAAQLICSVAFERHSQCIQPESNVTVYSHITLFNR